MSLKLELSPRRRIEAERLDVLDEGITEPEGFDHHWVAYIHSAAWAAGALLMVFVVPFWSGRFEPVLLGFLMAGVAAWLHARAHLDRFVVTDMRIFRTNGVLNQHTAAMSLSRIVDFTLEQPLLGQVFGYGHFVFENAAQDQGLREIRYIPRAAAIHKRIQVLVFRAGGGPAKHKQSSDAIPEPRRSDLDATGEIPVVP